MACRHISGEMRISKFNQERMDLHKAREGIWGQDWIWYCGNSGGKSPVCVMDFSITVWETLQYSIKFHLRGAILSKMWWTTLASILLLVLYHSKPCHLWLKCAPDNRSYNLLWAPCDQLQPTVVSSARNATTHPLASCGIIIQHMCPSCVEAV